ncbi:hypothetical protein Q8W71_17695 [Methylobacterium sp. NEAU 140]|uniref:phage tail assembly chaperone n=1 Tax=Methylobacterium sp. NEAU 140 TaxID=3064945 RepID=UPI002736C631|nr:hypothetical protein [Methylobacterium sp. NEAU 140]MDP4024462.1 hypothetical protein [Methylobacterium sp. NEAU 140]
MKWSGDLEWLEAEAAEDPTFDPPALRERPELWPHLAFVSAAFSELSTDRPIGAMGGCGPIPWTAIAGYAERYGLDDLDEFERFGRLIRAQDRIYLADVAKKLERKGK